MNDLIFYKFIQLYYNDDLLNYHINKLSKGISQNTMNAIDRKIKEVIFPPIDTEVALSTYIHLNNKRDKSTLNELKKKLVMKISLDDLKYYDKLLKNLGLPPATIPININMYKGIIDFETTDS